METRKKIREVEERDSRRIEESQTHIDTRPPIPTHPYEAHGSTLRATTTVDGKIHAEEYVRNEGRSACEGVRGCWPLRG